MATFTYYCPTCAKEMPHHSDGFGLIQREPDGRTFQTMECGKCKTSTKVFFTPGTNEFDQNLEAKDDTEA